MSKTYDKLSRINTQRLRDRNLLLDNQGKVPLTGPGIEQPANKKHRLNNSHQNGQGLLISALSILSLLLIIFNIGAFQAIRGMTSGDIATARKLASIEALLEKNSRQLDNLSEEIKAELKSSAYKAKIAHGQISELEKKSDGQAFVINNLVKVKDQLISRVAQLKN